MMKKLLIVLLVAMLLVVSVAPVAAYNGGKPEKRPPGWAKNPGNNDPISGPPGWSHVNPGKGGTEPPGQGIGK